MENDDCCIYVTVYSIVDSDINTLLNFFARPESIPYFP